VGVTTLNSATTYSVQLNGTTPGTNYDQLSVTGTVNLASATLSVSLGYTPAVGDSFTIVANDSVDPVTGTFSGQAEGSTITVNGIAMTISYVGGTGNDVVLSVALKTETWTGAVSNSWNNAGNWSDYAAHFDPLKCIEGPWFSPPTTPCSRIDISTSS